MEELIVKALELAGYTVKPTVDNLVECFKDYVDTGMFSNLYLEGGKVYFENGEELDSWRTMAKGLIRYCRR